MWTAESNDVESRARRCRQCLARLAQIRHGNAHCAPRWSIAEGVGESRRLRSDAGDVKHCHFTGRRRCRGHSLELVLGRLALKAGHDRYLVGHDRAKQIAEHGIKIVTKRQLRRDRLEFDDNGS